MHDSFCKQESCIKNTYPVFGCASNSFSTSFLIFYFLGCGFWRNRCMEEGAEELMDNPIQKSDVKKLRDHMKEFSNPQKYFEWEDKKSTQDRKIMQ